jgi:hypothetical protein
MKVVLEDAHKGRPSAIAPYEPNNYHVSFIYYLHDLSFMPSIA